MKILVTGASGQLGSDLVPSLIERGHDVLAPARATLDLAWPAERIGQYIAATRCDWVINCAAMTAVDACESQEALAMQLNRDAPGEMAITLARDGGRMLQVSTDYVFPGNASSPYTETDDTGPINVYGKSKLAGENAVRRALPDAAILRTSWVYGVHGHNFVKTILRKAAASSDAIRVVHDQVGAPTWTRDLAHTIAHLVESEAAGIFHFTNGGACSWYEFAVAIVEEAQAAGFDIRNPTVAPISTAEARQLFGIATERPAYSVLDTSKTMQLTGEDAPRHWRQSLRRMLDSLKSSV